MVRVALVLESASGYGWKAGLGIRRFAHERPSWELRVWEPSTERPESLARWRPQGVVGYLARPALIRALSRWKVPVVNVSQAAPRSPFPLVTVDNRKVGEEAARFLTTLRRKSYAVVGQRTTEYGRLRREGFLGALRAQGVRGLEFRPEQGRWLAGLDRWLESLPKPAAVFACDDFAAYHVARGSKGAGLLIPDELAILATDNEEEASRLVQPPLSSLGIPAERVGAEAAALLERLLEGARPPRTPILLPPLPVVERRSTGSPAGAPPVVTAALAYIAAHAHEGIRVADVVRQVPASRRTLERLFRSFTGRAIYPYIRRSRALPLKRLLAETSLTLEEIAERLGYHSAQHLSEFFRALEGCSPGSYRRRFGPASSRNPQKDR